MNLFQGRYDEFRSLDAHDWVTSEFIVCCGEKIDLSTDDYVCNKRMLKQLTLKQIHNRVLNNVIVCNNTSADHNVFTPQNFSEQCLEWNLVAVIW